MYNTIIIYSTETIVLTKYISYLYLIILIHIIYIYFDPSIISCNVNYCTKNYNLYDNFKKLQLENSIIRYMIVFKQQFIKIHGKKPNDLYKRLNKRKIRVEEEDKAI